MKRPDAAMALLKWKPGALLMLRALRDERSSSVAGLSLEMTVDAADALVAAGLFSFTTGLLTPLGVRALAWYDLETRNGRRISDDDDAPADEPAALDFDTPRRLPSFAFGAGK